MFDVIVVGGGHAGCEAAAASCRLGARTALITMRLDQIGAMSCNPAIGGLGKGILVREVDAWDGLIARAADDAAIHYRMLNRSKGPAVWGPRVQADRILFKVSVRRQLTARSELTLVEGHVGRVMTKAGEVTGVVLGDGTALRARTIVIASGTFLGGVLYCGEMRTDGGRIGERSATELADQFRDLALPLGRMKTGTPPRLDGRTIDWSRLSRQDSDDHRWTMSPMSTDRAQPQLSCAITRTVPRTHDIIRENMARSPLRTGAINGRGPRYCPSIEDKVDRFGDRDGHQIFLEPEGLNAAIIYPNGISTSLPREVQEAFVTSIPGLNRARIAEFGYAVEYDHVDPRVLDHRLGLGALPGLFLAGQINGTTGYEEAAAQGLVAGLNAACAALGRAPILFERSDSYIGVLVDDLVLQGVTEPYRMLTGRAEYRLRLRADNSGTRLTPAAIAQGAVDHARRSFHEAREALKCVVTMDVDGVQPSVMGLIDEVRAERAADALYAPYVERQDRDFRRLRQGDEDQLPISSAMKFGRVAGLSNEMVERLSAASPRTLGEARRVRGMTPAALSAILVEARRIG